MPVTDPIVDNFSNTTPAAPLGCVNVKWQANPPATDPRNISAYFALQTDSSAKGTIVGAINSSNTIFTLTGAPAAMIGFFWNGQIRVDYTVVGNQVTTVFVPDTGDWLVAVYFV